MKAKAAQTRKATLKKLTVVRTKMTEKHNFVSNHFTEQVEKDKQVQQQEFLKVGRRHERIEAANQLAEVLYLENVRTSGILRYLN